MCRKRFLIFSAALVSIFFSNQALGTYYDESVHHELPNPRLSFTLASLPLEIKFEVITFFLPEDLLALGAVDKGFCNLSRSACAVRSLWNNQTLLPKLTNFIDVDSYMNLEVIKWLKIFMKMPSNDERKKICKIFNEIKWYINDPYRIIEIARNHRVFFTDMILPKDEQYRMSITKALSKHSSKLIGGYAAALQKYHDVFFYKPIESFPRSQLVTALVSLSLDDIPVLVDAIDKCGQYYFTDDMPIAPRCAIIASIASLPPDEIEIRGKAIQSYFKNVWTDKPQNLIRRALARVSAEKIVAISETSNDYFEGVNFNIEKAGIINDLGLLEVWQIIKHAHDFKKMSFNERIVSMRKLRTYMWQIPDEILLHVLSFLPIDSLDNVRLVSKRFYFGSFETLNQYVKNLWNNIALLPSNVSGFSNYCMNRKLGKYLDNFSSIKDQDDIQHIRKIASNCLAFTIDPYKIYTIINNHSVYFPLNIDDSSMNQILSELAAFELDHLNSLSHAIKKCSLCYFSESMDDANRSSILKVLVQLKVCDIYARGVAINKNKEVYFSDLMSGSEISDVTESLAMHSANKIIAIARNSAIFFREDMNGTARSKIIDAIADLSVDEIDTIGKVIAQESVNYFTNDMLENSVAAIIASLIKIPAQEIITRGYAINAIFDKSFFVKLPGYCKANVVIVLSNLKSQEINSLIKDLALKGDRYFAASMNSETRVGIIELLALEHSNGQRKCKIA